MPAEKPRVALVYAPFGACRSPALGISLLKSALARRGIPCELHYLNLLLANQLGMRPYELIADSLRPAALLGEWLFAPSLFGENTGADRAYVEQVLWGGYRDTFTPAVVRELLRIREGLPAFVDACVERVDWSRYDWIGFSSSFHQHCASLALARRIKARYPVVRIVFGGSNCAGAMGAVLCRLFPFVDHVCTGYGEVAFPSLVEAAANGDASPSIPGIVSRDGEGGYAAPHETARVDDLNALPYPDYSDYLEQIERVQRPPEFDVWIPMEASRGCWWGEKRQCTFCGLNTTELAFRSKSPGRFLDELRTLCENYGDKITLVDSILAQPYFRTVLPELARGPGPSLTWEVKATLTREQILLLAQARVKWIQPGIESLSDPILRLMRKGTTLTHNIQVLKWAKQFGIEVIWNLLWGFPGEDPAEYEAMQRLIPQLLHLDAPNGHGHVRIDRFSAYWISPASHGITKLRPAGAYRTIYHALSEEELHELAYFFDAEYADVSPLYAGGMEQAVKAWQARSGAALDLYLSPGSIRIVDTRRDGAALEHRFEGLAAELYLLCDAAQTVRALMETPGVSVRAGEEQVVALLDHFVEQGLMIRAAKRYLSLAILREHRHSDQGEP
jgi:ribosomal peptide maturation radical SAM protein 1